MAHVHKDHNERVIGKATGHKDVPEYAAKKTFAAPVPVGNQDHFANCTGERGIMTSDKQDATGPRTGNSYALEVI